VALLAASLAAGGFLLRRRAPQPPREDDVKSLIVAMFSVTATALLAAGAFVALRKRRAVLARYPL